MIRSFSRADNSGLSRWWWSLDRWTFALVISLLGIGLLMTLAASPAVAERIRLDSFYFAKRHIIYLVMFFVTMVAVSLMEGKHLRRFSLVLFTGSVFLLILTPFLGAEIKGARRWINFAGLSIQPSEFIKPALIVLTAWMLSEHKKDPKIPGNMFAFLFYGVTVGLLLLQPDMGMVVLITTIFFFQFFLCGLPILLIGLVGIGGAGGLVAAYYLFPHVHERVDRFLFPDMTTRFNERYQITQSLDAFSHGGFWGQGPGEGTVKKHLPDAHADFIFSVAGEEYGFLLCAVIVILFGIIVVRSISRVFQQNDMFAILAVSGLVFQIGIQAFINMASTLDMIPTKGMTLPFISFGGSSILSVAIITGMILGLTKRKYQ